MTKTIFYEIKAVYKIKLKKRNFVSFSKKILRITYLSLCSVCGDSPVPLKSFPV